MITKTYDSKRGTWIYDAGEYRAIVYKVGSKWMLRAGPRRNALIAPETEVLKDYKQRRLANEDAFEYLGHDVTE